MQKSGARSSAIMASGTLVSRILGFVKTFLITVAIGSAATMADVFQLANTLPNLIYVLIAGGVFNAVLVPQIIKASKAQDEGADYISRLITLAVIALLVITAAVCGRRSRPAKAAPPWKSTRTKLNSSGRLPTASDAMIVWRSSDLPEPVVPAMRP